MGMHASGQIFYGYIWDEEGDGPFEDNRDDELEIWDQMLKDRGVVDPYSLPDRPDTTGLPYKEEQAIYREWHNKNQDKFDAYYAAKNALPEELGCEGVDMDHYGHCDYSAKALVIKASCKSTEWSEKLDPTELVAGEDWDARLLHWAETTGADLSNAEGPGWYLTTYYG